jgi:hypothetical protein
MLLYLNSLFSCPMEFKLVKCMMASVNCVNPVLIVNLLHCAVTTMNRITL